MNKFLKFSIVMLVLSITLQAQDFNFSQFYNSPIYINPANSGRIDRDFRIGLIHRSAFNTYTNSALMADINFVNPPLKADLLGAGLVVYNDQQGNGQFSNNGFLISGAAHYSLDELKKHRVSIGIQMGMSFGNFSATNLKFTSDFDPNTNNFSETTSNNISPQSNTAFKANVGLIYNLFLNKNFDVFAGANVFNLIPPKQSYISTASSSTPIRLGFQLGANYMLKDKFQFSPAVSFINQSSTRDIILGMNFSYYLVNDLQTNRKTAITLGGWHRLNDAAIVYVGGRMNGFQLGFSYDLTVSSLSNAKGSLEQASRNFGTGAWEISLFYSGFLNRPIPDKTTIPCRTF